MSASPTPLASDVLFCSQDILFAIARQSLLLATLVVANRVKVTSAVLAAVSCTTSRTAPLYRTDVLLTIMATTPDAGLPGRLGQMNVGSACPILP
jgi:hypothetical protein